MSRDFQPTKHLIICKRRPHGTELFNTLGVKSCDIVFFNCLHNYITYVIRMPKTNFWRRLLYGTEWYESWHCVQFLYEKHWFRRKVSANQLDFFIAIKRYFRHAKNSYFAQKYVQNRFFRDKASASLLKTENRFFIFREPSI